MADADGQDKAPAEDISVEECQQPLVPPLPVSVPVAVATLRSKRFDASMPRRKTLTGRNLLSQDSSDEDDTTFRKPSISGAAQLSDLGGYRSPRVRRPASTDLSHYQERPPAQVMSPPSRALSFAEVMARLEQEDGAASSSENVTSYGLVIDSPASPAPSSITNGNFTTATHNSHRRQLSSSSAAARQLARLSADSPLWSPGASIEDLFASTASRDDLSLSHPHLMQEYKVLRRRQAIIRELVTTEMAFSEDMNIVVQEFQEQVDSCEGFGAVDTRLIFGSVGPVAEFANDFSFELVTAANPILFEDGTDMPRWQEADGTTRIGSTFASFLGRLQKVYSNYCSGHERAAARLFALQKIPTVAAWLAERHPSDRATSWDLASLMIKPVQRVLKYPLLLGSLLEATPKNHEDYWFIELALKDMLTAAETINRMQKRQTLIGSAERKAPFDLQAGLAKTIARRTTRLKQSAGLEPLPDSDPVYDRLQESYKLQQSLLSSLRAEVTEWLQAMRQSLDYHAIFAKALLDFECGDMPSVTQGTPSWGQYSAAINELQTRTLIELTHGLEREVFKPLSTLEGAYNAPSSAMRRRDDLHSQVHRLRVKLQNGATSDPTQATAYDTLLDQYDALNATLILELPQMLGCARRAMKYIVFGLTQIQSSWYGSWVEQLELLFAPGSDPYAIREPFHERFDIILALASELTLTAGATQRYKQQRGNPRSRPGTGGTLAQRRSVPMSGSLPPATVAANTARLSSDSSNDAASLSSLGYSGSGVLGPHLGRVASAKSSSISSITTSGPPSRVRSGSMNLAHAGGSSGHLPGAGVLPGSRLSSRPSSNRNSYTSALGGSSLHSVHP